ncbi:hypothetical protein HYX13_01580 [Candidatus Woesearchaeota archaeon]|nr:hypothetical protein [Candidatus Woesearchaeota archaeon]
MTSLQAFQFLVTAAKVDQKQRQTFSRIEITKKLNEIKYLSAQKKVPKLSLRKEILHLEHKVSRLLEMEEHIKQQDSLKITTLKKEVALLKKKLSAAADKDMAKRVDKLVHLLGESLAKRGVARELMSQQNMQMQNMQKKGVHSRLQRARLLRTKLEALKRQLEIMKLLEKDPRKIHILDQQMRQWEMQLQLFLKKHPEVKEPSLGSFSENNSPVVASGTVPSVNPSVNPSVKHTFMFEPHSAGTSEGKLDEGIEQLFPVPPPPKVRIKKEE